MINENETKLKAQMLTFFYLERQLILDDARNKLKNENISFHSLCENLFEYEKCRIFYEYKTLIFFMNYFENTFTKTYCERTGISKNLFKKREINKEIDDILNSDETITKKYKHEDKEKELSWDYICSFMLNLDGFYK